MPDKDEAQPSLTEVMSAAYDELSEPEETAEAVVAEANIPDPEKTEDEAEVVAAGDETATDDQDETDETEDDTQPLAAPKHWSDEDRKVFEALDAGAQEFLLRRHREMEADYTKKTTEVAEQRKAIEPLEQVLAPYRSAWSTHGVSDAQAMQRLLQAQASLATNPVQTLQYLAQTYNVDLSQLTPADTQSDYTDPEVKALRDEINQLRTHLTQRDTEQSNVQQQTLQQQIDSFANEADTDGNVLHPHFATVQNRMAALINAERQLGNTLTLKDAYDQAVQLDPTVRVHAESAARKLQEQELEKQAAARAAKARRAAKTNVRSTGAGGTKPKQPTDILSGLKEAADQLGFS